MHHIPARPLPRALLALLALVLAGLALGAATSAAGAADKAQTGKHGKKERLVVRGDATIVDNPSCPGGVCDLAFVDGKFRGTPVGTGAYDGALKLKVAEAFSNGEDGVCAPIDGPHHARRRHAEPPRARRLRRLVPGRRWARSPPRRSPTLSRFTVKYGTGTYAGARGSGVASFSEDAGDRDRMTVIGTITR